MEDYQEEIPLSAYPEFMTNDNPTKIAEEVLFNQFDAETTLEELEIYRQYGTEVLGEETGLESLNIVLGRYMRPGSLGVLAADTGAGKSVLGAQLALHVAEKGGGVLFWSGEMTQGELHKRLVANTSRLNGSSIELGMRGKSSTKRVKVKEEFRRIAQLPLYVESSGEGNLEDVEKMIIEYKKHHNNLRMVIVDYLQILDAPPGLENASEYVQLKHNTRLAKKIAARHGIFMLLVSQLNRSHVDREPRKSDLHGASSIEKDADLVIFIYDDLTKMSKQNRRALERAQAQADVPVEHATENTRIIYTAKNRKGPEMACLAEFYGAQTRFASMGVSIAVPYTIPDSYTDSQQTAREALSTLLTLPTPTSKDIL